MRLQAAPVTFVKPGQIRQASLPTGISPFGLLSRSVPAESLRQLCATAKFSSKDSFQNMNGLMCVLP